jgi:hypothetical protein
VGGDGEDGFWWVSLGGAPSCLCQLLTFMSFCILRTFWGSSVNSVTG